MTVTDLNIAVVEAVERVAVAAATVGKTAPTTAVEKATEIEAAVTRRSGAGGGAPGRHEGGEFGRHNREMVAAVGDVVELDAGMTREAVPKTALQAPPARPRNWAPTRRGQSSDGKNTSDAFPGGYCFLCRVPAQIARGGRSRYTCVF